MGAIMIVRIRGGIGVNEQIEDTMRFLHLTRTNHAVVWPDDKVIRGMLQKAKDYITWGAPSEKLLAEVMSKRGRLIGDHPLTDKHVKSSTEYASIKALAKAVSAGEANYNKVEGIKPLFRMHPPRKGLKAIKRHVNAGGDLGNRGERINDLLERML